MRLIDADLIDEQELYNCESVLEAIDYIMEQLTVNTWIPCSERFPEEPKENPVFDNKPLELYLVSEKDADYPFRAFWNGKTFTDGFGKLNVIAWQPLPSVWKGENNAEK